MYSARQENTKVPKIISIAFETPHIVKGQAFHSRWTSFPNNHSVFIVWQDRMHLVRDSVAWVLQILLYLVHYRFRPSDGLHLQLRAALYKRIAVLP